MLIIYETRVSTDAIDTKIKKTTKKPVSAIKAFC